MIKRVRKYTKPRPFQKDGEKVEKFMFLTSTTTTKLKAEYREVAKRIHPDVNKDPKATDQFKALQAEFEDKVKAASWGKPKSKITINDFEFIFYRSLAGSAPYVIQLPKSTMPYGSIVFIMIGTAEYKLRVPPTNNDKMEAKISKGTVILRFEPDTEF
tara:strand:+ start:3078 stop:3551 length:474 start_codon:yes stop_codon:yes gene_type:complete